MLPVACASERVEGVDAGSFCSLPLYQRPRRLSPDPLVRERLRLVNRVWQRRLLLGLCGLQPQALRPADLAHELFSSFA